MTVSLSISDPEMQLPEEFTSYTRAMMGDRLYGLWAEGMSAPSPTSIRLHPIKSQGKVIKPDFHPEKVAWCGSGYYLSERPNFTFDPLLHSGTYYVQEASSMFVDEVLRQHVSQPVVMLDLCAAPGGKSTTALTALPPGSLLFANEPIPLRAQILMENLQKYGHPDTIVTQNYPADYARSGLMFDVILTDVPCSGEGMFRKDPGAITEWSVTHVDNCYRLQREIVRHAWSCLRPGGLLIYSTCTLNTRENEQNIIWAMQELGAEPVAVSTDPTWGITSALDTSCEAPVYRFIPGVSLGEGLFMAVLRKTSVSDSHSQEPSFSSKKKKSRKEPSRPNLRSQFPMTSKWLQEPDLYTYHLTGDRITAIPKRWESIYDTACLRLKVVHAGVGLATVKGRDLVPRHELALSEELSPEAFPTVSVDADTAIAYLRKEAISLPSDMPLGHVLVSYHGQPLGFVKHLGNRSNNLYPPEWKIRSTHIPENNREILTKI